MLPLKCFLESEDGVASHHRVSQGRLQSGDIFQNRGDSWEIVKWVSGGGKESGQGLL